MKVPMMPPERIFGQIWAMVLPSGRTRVIFSVDFAWALSRPAMMRSTPAITSATAKRPISTGMKLRPPFRLVTPKVKRCLE